MLAIPLIFMVISIDPPLVFLLMFGAYALSGPLYWYWRRRRGLEDSGSDVADDGD
jgi:CDP-diacylglycerol--serine O-phosphatidyltransferase